MFEAQFLTCSCRVLFPGSNPRRRGYLPIVCKTGAQWGARRLWSMMSMVHMNILSIPKMHSRGRLCYTFLAAIGIPRWRFGM